MILKNDIGLIGDLVNTFPLMYYLSKKEPLKVIPHPEAKGIYNLMNPSYRIELVEGEEYDLEINILSAFSIARDNNLHMTQAYFASCGLPVPKTPIKPDLYWKKEECEYVDIIISPFSRSLPEKHKPTLSQWIEIIEAFPDKKILLLGNSKHDNPLPFLFDNVEIFFDNPLEVVLNRMNNCGVLVSVVTGTSHLAYSVGCKNILLTKQGTSGWGINPDAICIENFETDLIIKTIKNEL